MYVPVCWLWFPTYVHLCTGMSKVCLSPRLYLGLNLASGKFLIEAKCVSVSTVADHFSSYFKTLYYQMPCSCEERQKFSLNVATRGILDGKQQRKEISEKNAVNHTISVCVSRYRVTSLDQNLTELT
ncbi:hypothetical protein AMECASPLE_013873 [Ameca splendens]|uniref:Uncharacterized protein n=1 Tax=Ameca splendens TaxID=208324 RepID=A0ABV0XQG9_9TELE